MGKKKGADASPSPPSTSTQARRRQPRVAVLVPNLFLLVPVETAVKSAGALPVPVREPEGVREAGCTVFVVDLEPLAEQAAARLAPLCRAGVAVLAFGPHVQGDTLAAVRAVGAVALPRSAFFPRLPELLELALRTGGGKRPAERGPAPLA